MARLIDADALREELDERSRYDTYSDYSMVLDTIDLADTVKAEPVRNGKWEIHAYGIDGEDVYCSICKKGSNLPYWNYCPNCGAKMT